MANDRDQITIFKQNSTGKYWYINSDGNWEEFTTSGSASTTKIYRALISQLEQSAPTATILENSLDFTPTWTRQSAGVYYINETFDGAKTFGICNTSQISAARGNEDIKFYFDNDEYNESNQFFLADLSEKPSDFNGDWQIPVEIRLYE